MFVVIGLLVLLIFVLILIAIYMYILRGKYQLKIDEGFDKARSQVEGKFRGGNKTTYNPTTSSTEGVIVNPQTSFPQQMDREIKIEHFSFNPRLVKVKTGTKITWINNDNFPHTVTSDDGVFDSQTIETGNQFSYTPHKKGSFSYYCKLHDHMNGTIIAE